MDVVSYVVSSLAILWSFAGGQTDFFQTRSFAAALVCAFMAYLLLKKCGKLKSVKPNSASWMMGVGIGCILFLVSLVLAWFFKGSPEELNDLKELSLPALLVWTLVLAPACEVIYRKVLGPNWGIKSSAFIEALNFGVAAVNFYLFCVVFLMGYLNSRFTLRFGLSAAIVARSLGLLLTLLSLKAFF